MRMTIRPVLSTVCAIASTSWLTVAAQSERTQWDGVYTKEQATRGEALYSAQCASCHGADLAGAEMAPALTGIEFSNNWNGLPLRDLFERIRTTMPQNDPQSLSGQQTADILAFVLSSGSYPAGQAELPNQAERLTSTVFKMYKP